MGKHYISKNSRADGQHTFRGEFISENGLIDIIEKNCKKIVFNGSIIEE